jgi:hypothetical protein
MKRVETGQEDEVRPEYDFSQLKGRVRGKYAERYREGTYLALPDPDVAAAFPDAKAVNDAYARRRMSRKGKAHSNVEDARGRSARAFVEGDFEAVAEVA